MIFRFERDTNHKIQMKLSKLRQCLQKNLLHTSSKISKKIKVWEKFLKKSWKTVQIKGKSFLNVISIDQLSWIFFSTRANTFEKRMGVCHFRNIIPFFVPKCYWGKVYIRRWYRKSWGEKKDWTDAYWTRSVSKYCWCSCSHEQPRMFRCSGIWM